MARKTLIDALGLAELAPEEQEELLLDLNELVYKGAMVRILSTLDEETKSKLEQLLDSSPDERAVEAFLENNIPEANQAVEDTIREIRDDIMAVTGESQD
jgi:hypothetical protein